MADAYYNLAEVMEKLGRDEEGIKELVRNNELNEWRDTSRPLYKVQEVERLAQEINVAGAAKKAEPPAEEEVLEIPDFEEALEISETADTGAVENVLGIEETAAPAEEVLEIPEEVEVPKEMEVPQQPQADQAEEVLEIPEETATPADEEAPEAIPAEEELEIPELGEGERVPEAAESEVELILEEAGAEENNEEAGEELELGDDELNLGELTGADTSITTAGINVLGDTDDMYKLSGDTKGETKLADAAKDKGETEEATAEFGDLGDDMNLESVGSGSGLLDLSLQADDTSLGAVLDDILPAATEGEAAGEGAVAEEAEKIFEQTESQPEMPVMLEPVAVQYAEPEPDATSNAYGIALWLPFVATIYAAIVLFAGAKEISPGIVEALSGTMAGIGLIWIVGIGLAVGVLAVVGIGLTP